MLKENIKVRGQALEAAVAFLSPHRVQLTSSEIIIVADHFEQYLIHGLPKDKPAKPEKPTDE